MAFDSQEEEQIDAIKNWWKANGNAVLMGVSLGFILLFGWRFYNDHLNTQAEEASMMYEQVMLHVKNKDHDKALNAGQTLMSKHPESLYATLASLMMAKENLSPENSGSSEANLQWVIDNSKQTEWVHLARIRKARLLLNGNKLDGALALIPPTFPESFTALYASLKGDIYLAKNDNESAKKAYDNALAQIDFGGQARQLVQIKRDSLGGNNEDVFSGVKPQVEMATDKKPADTAIDLTATPNIEVTPVTKTPSVAVTSAPAVEVEAKPAVASTVEVAPVIVETAPVTTAPVVVPAPVVVEIAPVATAPVVAPAPVVIETAPVTTAPVVVPAPVVIETAPVTTAPVVAPVAPVTTAPVVIPTPVVTAPVTTTPAVVPPTQ